MLRVCSTDRIPKKDKRKHSKNHSFGVHCFAIPRELLETKYPDVCSVQGRAQKPKNHGTTDLQ